MRFTHDRYISYFVIPRCTAWHTRPIARSPKPCASHQRSYYSVKTWRQATQDVDALCQDRNWFDHGESIWVQGPAWRVMILSQHSATVPVMSRWVDVHIVQIFSALCICRELSEYHLHYHETWCRYVPAQMNPKSQRAPTKADDITWLGSEGYRGQY